MTSTYVTLAARAERAVLGALLQRPDLYSYATYLEPAQFANPSNAALFDAIRAELVREPEQTGSALAAHLQAAYATTAADPGINALIDACPDPGAVAAYARILVEADLTRTMDAHAARLAVTTPPDSRERAEAAALARLEPTTSPDAEQAPVPGSWKGSRPNREESILADLVQHPDQIEQASGSINAATFTSAARDDLFEAIAAVHDRGEPVDTLTIAWELDCLQVASHRGSGVDPAAYVDRLAMLPVEAGAAHENARQIASQERLVAGRDARPRQPAGPAHRGPAVERPVGRRVDHDAGVRPQTYDRPSPGNEHRGPRPGF